MTCLLFFSIYSYSQVYKYSPIQNVVKTSDCRLTKNGFELSGTTNTTTANNDLFKLDIDSKKFYWKDNKGSNNQDIFGFKTKRSNLNTQFVFNTETNIIRITDNKIGQSVVEIFFKSNNDWYCLSYLCKTNN